MNKFTQHIPNYFEGFEPEVFEFTDLDDLINKLGKDKSSLVYDDEHVLSVNKDGTYWRVLGRVDNPVEGLCKWRGRPYMVVEVETIFGYGLEKFKPKIISEPFQIWSKEDIKMYSGFRGSIIGELKDGRCFMGVDK